MRWKKEEMKRFLIIKRSLRVFVFLTLFFSFGISLCQQNLCDEKIFNNNTQSFNEQISQYITNPRSDRNEQGKLVSKKQPLAITRKFERYALSAGYLRKDMIENEYVVSSSKEKISEEQEDKLKAEYKESTKGLEILLLCSSDYIKLIIKNNKKYKNFDEYLNLISNSYINIKNIIRILRTEYRKTRAFFNLDNTYINNILEKIYEWQMKIALMIKNVSQDSEIWKKDVGRQSLENILPKYSVFFKNYENLKKEFDNLTPENILYYLFQSGTLKIVTSKIEKGTQEDLVSVFIEKLQKFLFVLEKSWFVSNKKNLINNAKEIIKNLQSIYPVYPKQSSIDFITKSEDFPSVFVVDIGAVLWAILNDLNVNIRNIHNENLRRGINR